jgi:hypothetical protein
LRQEGQQRFRDLVDLTSAHPTSVKEVR